MGVQIIGLRPFLDKNNKEKLKHEHFTTVESVPILFKTLDATIEKIPESERYNVYFTVLDCADPRENKGQLRRFKSQEIFPFDIDGIDQSRQQTYIDIFFQITALDTAKTIVLCSGNGLQFFAQFDKPFTDVLYFEQKRLQYKALCERIDKAMADAGVPGRADPSVWSPARLMRLPNTENRKKDKGTKKSYIISNNLAPQEILWDKMAGVAEIKPGEAVDWSDTKPPLLDHKEMYKGCNFLKASVENPKEFRETHYYAALSIVGRMDNGRDRAHNLASAIKDSGNGSTVGSYSHADIEKKLDQALIASGPRTCKNINSIWGKCASCPNYKKVVSPVSLKGLDHIATKDSGFHIATKDGPKPHFEDLLKYFDQLHHHKVIDQNGLPFVWKSTHYELIPKTSVQAFAQLHFSPKPKTAAVKEFENLVGRTGVITTDFFTKDINNQLNFKNGVYNFKTKEFYPHNPELGFRYVLPYDYDPAATAPRFEQFLDEVTDNDKNLRAILEEFGGYALSGDEYWIHKTLFLLGDGANGKSIFIKVLKACAGAKNYSTVSMKDLANENNRQLLEGKLFNIAPELAKDSLRDTEKFKYLSDGSEITVKLMWNQPYQIVNRAKMIYACNDIPESDDPGYAFLRRMVIVPFNRTFEGVDADEFIMDKLEKELPGIMNVFIRGYERLLKQRAFTVAATSTEEREWYEMDINVVKEFLAETAAVTEHELNGRCHFAGIADLRRKFDDWALNTGRQEETKRITMNKFGRMFQKTVKKGRARRGIKKIQGVVTRGYWDIELMDA
jgi:P4 family phage/plasmid primase-like protien